MNGFPGYYDDLPEKRFVVFGYDSYYPMGPIADYIGSYDTWDECVDGMKDKSFDYYDMFDCQERKWVNI